MLQPFTIIYEDGPERIATYTASANTADQVVALAEAFFTEHPEHDPRRGYQSLTVRVVEGFLYT
jgi:hypothetical protein